MRYHSWLVYHIAARQVRTLDPNSPYGKLVNLVVWWAMRLIAAASVVLAVFMTAVIAIAVMGWPLFLLSLAVVLEIASWIMRRQKERPG
jgi:hypothetical protein